MTDDEFVEGFQNRRVARMNAIDQMAPELRSLVNEYGYNTVNAFVMCGVTKPKRIRHLVETVLDEFSPTRGSFSSQGRNPNSPIPATAA